MLRLTSTSLLLAAVILVLSISLCVAPAQVADTLLNPDKPPTPILETPWDELTRIAPTPQDIQEDLEAAATRAAATPTTDFLTTPIPTDTPLPPTATPITQVRFAVIGDYGESGVPERDVARLVKSWEPDFIITTGDNNYPDGTYETIDENIGKYYHKFIYPYTGEYGEGADINRFFPTMGNHDWSITNGKAYLDYFTLPGNERYYAVLWGPVHLFALDSDSREPDGVGASSEQAAWLKRMLADSPAPWKIVYTHHPPYASAGEDGSVDWMQWPYQEWGATTVLAGHAHVYERLVLNGFPYFICALGGGPIYTFHDEPLQWSKVRFRGDYGAMLVEATLDQITFQFITRENKRIDEYTIQAED